MIKWELNLSAHEAYCVAEIEHRAIMIVLTDDLRWRWRVELTMKGRRPTGECATLDEAKKNAVAAYRYVTEADGRNALNQERDDVVAFLREQAGQWDRDHAGWAALNHASVMIERGLHRAGEGA
jgi:hypothetical protein